MDKGRILFGGIGLLLICLGIVAGIIAMNNVYQHQWRKTFAWAHLDLAEASSDIQTQYNEVTRVITILDAFPKEGNWDFFNKLNPKTNLANAWQALYEIEDYAAHTANLSKSDAAYNIAVYNNQEKMQYFETQYHEAFTEYIRWGLSGWIGGLSTILTFIGVCVNLLTIFWANDDHGADIWFWVFANAIWIVALGFFVWVGLAPVFYAGPI